MQWPLMLSEGTDHLVNGSSEFLGRDHLGQASIVGGEHYVPVDAKLP